MEQQTFKKILERYLNNSCTPEEEALIEEWFQNIGMSEEKGASDEEERRLFEIYESDFQKILTRREAKAFSLSAHSHLWLKLAAAVLIILSSLLYIYVLRDEVRNGYFLSDTVNPIAKEIINTQSSAYPIALSDGSEVVLNPGAILTFKFPFEDGIREVSLEGEAFFNVERDPSAPFVVKTGQIVARVLGTSFTVKANKQDEDIIVTVKTGKVSVEQVPSGSGKSRKPEVLTPNQQAIYNIQKRSMSRIELEEAGISVQPRSWQRRRFREAPVGEILRAVERTFGTRIILEKSNLKGCLLSTSISADEDIFYRLDIICKAIGATYRVDGVSIIVSGKSCD